MLLATLVLLAGNISVETPAGVFTLKVCNGACYSYQNRRIIPVAGYTSCESNEIHISGDLTPRQQAKAIEHEFVHVALSCDRRNIDLEEKIAQSISAMLDNKAICTFIQNVK